MHNKFSNYKILCMYVCMCVRVCVCEEGGGASALTSTGMVTCCVCWYCWGGSAAEPAGGVAPTTPDASG